MSQFQIAVRAAGLAGALLAGLILAGASQAGPQGKGRRIQRIYAQQKGQKGTGKRAQGAYAQQVKELRAIHLLLSRADHDYKGHRVKAMKHIHAAVVALQPGAGKNQGGKGARGGRERQQLSDAQLRAAIRDLRAVETQLATVVNPATNRAVASIRGAIKELEIALTIR